MKSRLFAGVEDAVLRQIAAAAQVRCLGPKTKITFKGERPDHLFVLKKGRARSYIVTESGSEVLVFWVAPGVVLGLVSLLADPPNYMVNATTVAPCEFLVWDRGTVRRFAKAVPQILENSFKLALHYLAIYMRRHANLVSGTAESRLAQTLLQLATEAGEVRPSGILIDITNEHLSSLADISFFTASRILSRWEHDHTISKQRGRVTLLSPEALMVA
jgi:CRP-like cAMP-binding protein